LRLMLELMKEYLQTELAWAQASRDADRETLLELVETADLERLALSFGELNAFIQSHGRDAQRG
jgi:hypothetical protein